METKSVFISSCSRREMARRRPSARGLALRLQLLISALVLLAALATFVALHGGL
jgi:hypothetical protein